jgi:hypothetical protein
VALPETAVISTAAPGGSGLQLLVKIRSSMTAPGPSLRFSSARWHSVPRHLAIGKQVTLQDCLGDIGLNAGSQFDLHATSDV